MYVSAPLRSTVEPSRTVTEPPDPDAAAIYSRLLNVAEPPERSRDPPLSLKSPLTVLFPEGMTIVSLLAGVRVDTAPLMSQLDAVFHALSEPFYVMVSATESDAGARHPAHRQI